MPNNLDKLSLSDLISMEKYIQEEKLSFLSHLKNYSSKLTSTSNLTLTEEESIISDRLSQQAFEISSEIQNRKRQIFLSYYTTEYTDSRKNHNH